jgi:murein L,D-transpeptidase YcbB/YkuD
MYKVQSGIKYYNRTIGKWEFLSSSRDYPKILNMNPQFDKKFKILSSNQPSRDTIFPTQQPEQQPEQQQRVVPQTFNDLLQGKGFLKLGDKSTAVKELQEKLISLGYGVSRATGYFGNETQKAVGEFQLLNKDKLKRDFAVGKDTGSVLNNAVQLRQRRNQQQTQPLPSVQRGVPQSNIQAPITGIKI